MIYQNSNQFWSSSKWELQCLLDSLKVCAVVISVNGIYYAKIFDPIKNGLACKKANVKYFKKTELDQKMEELRVEKWERGESFCKNNTK